MPTAAENVQWAGRQIEPSFMPIHGGVWAKAHAAGTRDESAFSDLPGPSPNPLPEGERPDFDVHTEPLALDRLAIFLCGHLRTFGATTKRLNSKAQGRATHLGFHRGTKDEPLKPEAQARNVPETAEQRTFLACASGFHTDLSYRAPDTARQTTP
jgi:hypothetical protein